MDATRDKSHSLYDFIPKLSSKNGIKIVGEPTGNDSGEDHQNINAELDKKNAPIKKDWILFNPRLIDIPYIKSHVTPADIDVTNWEAIPIAKYFSKPANLARK